MKTNFLGIFALANVLLILSCGQAKKDTETANKQEMEAVASMPNYDTSDPQSILKAVEKAHGGWGPLNLVLSLWIRLELLFVPK